jgi:hypothetical protein
LRRRFQEDAFVFAHCAADALRGDLKRLSEYGLLRHDVHARVVAGVDRLTRSALILGRRRNWRSRFPQASPAQTRPIGEIAIWRISLDNQAER